MASVNDVAAYILAKQSPMTAMKLQKLCYYAQAWHVTWSDDALFEAPIEAWANGPVVPELYRQHRGQFHISTWESGDSKNLTEDEAESIDVVLDTYGAMTAYQLSELTHSEDPWINAREGLSPDERSNREILPSAMQEFYLAQCAI